MEDKQDERETSPMVKSREEMKGQKCRGREVGKEEGQKTVKKKR